MRSLPLASLAALSAGSFLVHAQAPPLLADHLEGTSALAREHVHHSSLEGTVLGADGKPLAGAKVLVYGYQPFYWALPLGQAATDAHGAYRIDDVSGVGRSRLFVVSPDGTPLRTTDQSLTLVAGRHTKMRPVTLSVPAEAPAVPSPFRGRVLAGDGAPIAGVLVRLLQSGGGFDPGCFTFTDAHGAFALAARGGRPERAHVLVGRSKLDIENVAGEEKLVRDPPDWKLDLSGERTLQAKELVNVPLSARGADGVEFAWNLGGTFVACAGDRVATLDRDGPVSVAVRATAKGHVPRLFDAPAAQPVDFSGDRPMELTVVDGAGGPLPGALVDVCSEEHGRRFQELCLQTLRTGQDGRLRLLGPATPAHVVYVHAEGHDPVRARWVGGTDLRVVATRRSGRLRVACEDDVSTLYVRRAGTFDIAAMAYLRKGGLELDLAPGDYEVTRYGGNGPAAAAEPCTVRAGATTTLALTRDLRPTVLVTAPSLPPDDKWWAHAGRSAIGGMILKWQIHSTRGGPMPTRELVAVVEKLDAPRADSRPGESRAATDSRAAGGPRFLLRLPTSGRYTLTLGHEKLGARLIREVVAEFGQDYSVVVPALEGTLTGEVAEFPEVWAGGAIHGIAGPRLCLEPEGSTPFGVLVGLPEPKKFTLAKVPPGSFTLQHHLYETGIFFSDSGTWGGAPLSVSTETPAAAGTLGRGPDGQLEVSVLDANGRAAAGTLAIRDRMYESWERDLAENTTLDDAMDAIPTPPSERLVDGRARLAKVRKGRVQMTLLLDDGRRVFFTRDVEPGKPLEVRLSVLR